MNETLKVLEERRSVRGYDGRKVPREVLEQIVKAGEYAPSGMGLQSAAQVVIQDDETIEQLSKINARIMGSSGDPFYGAKTLIVVFADKNRPTHVDDGNMVIGNILNAAHALGVDSCYIYRARETFHTEEGKKLMQKWGLPDNYEGIGNCILGYRSGEYPKAKPRRAGAVIWAD